jgi:hypothetical protein
MLSKKNLILDLDLDLMPIQKLTNNRKTLDMVVK